MMHMTEDALEGAIKEAAAAVVDRDWEIREMQILEKALAETKKELAAARARFYGANERLRIAKLMIDGGRKWAVEEAKETDNA